MASDIIESINKLKKTVMERCRDRIEEAAKHKGEKQKETCGSSSILKRKHSL